MDPFRHLSRRAFLGKTSQGLGSRALASTADFVHHRTEKLTPFLSSARLKETA